MDAYKQLLKSKDKAQNNGRDQHKDKLEQTKLRERELKEAHKAEVKAKKEVAEMEARQEAALLKEERMMHDSKRAAKDRRDAAKKEEHKETGAMCEHGVWRCKICFPPRSAKDKDSERPHKTIPPPIECDA